MKNDRGEVGYKIRILKKLDFCMFTRSFTGANVKCL